MTSPKVLFYDLENTPSLGYYYDLWKEGNIVSKVKDWYLLSFAYRWQHESKVHSRALCDYPAFDKDKSDDKSLCRDLWDLFDEADYLVAHNGDKFDIKKAQARFIVHGFNPYTPAKSIDTLKLARKHFKFDSNSLDSLGQALGVGRKLPTTGWHLWRACIEGDREAYKKMKRYNEQDVRLLCAVYEKLAPWHATHPDLSGFNGNCPVCQSAKVQARGFNLSRAGRKRRYQCASCSHWWADTRVTKEAA